ncbi:hypothetical protein HEL35_023205, partial [Escherichia coli]|nr:hypothetical protein [Escherichia coli]
MSYLNLRLYQRNTQCLHIRKHRLAGFFVQLFVACAFAAQAPLSSAELYGRCEQVPDMRSSYSSGAH